MSQLNGLALIDWLYIAICLLLALACLLMALRLLRRAHVMQQTAAVRVAMAEPGYRKLVGLTAPYGGEPVIAPLSRTPCVWYCYRIEEMSEGGLGRKRRWRTIQSDTSEHLLVLRDDSGDCLIDPEGAEVYPLNRQQWYGNTPVATEALSGTEAADALLLQGMSGKQYRFSEQRMHIGDPIYALGEFRTVAAQDGLPEEKDAVRELLRTWKQMPEVIAQYDADGDGKLTAQEWDQVVAAARAQVQHEFRQASQLPAHHLLSRPRDGRPLLLSATSHPKAPRQYHWLALLAILTAVVFAVSALSMLGSGLAR